VDSGNTPRFKDLSNHTRQGCRAAASGDGKGWAKRVSYPIRSALPGGVSTIALTLARARTSIWEYSSQFQIPFGGRIFFRSQLAGFEFRESLQRLVGIPGGPQGFLNQCRGAVEID